MKRHFVTLKQNSKWAVVLVLSSALIVGCTSKAAGPVGTPGAQEQQIKTVKIAKVSKQKIGDPQEQIGDVVSSIQLDIVTKSGGEVVEILKKRGEKVSKGDILFKLDSSDIELQKEQSLVSVKSASAGLTKAREDLANARTELVNTITKTEQSTNDTEEDYNKAHNDYDLGLITKEELDQAETKLNNAKLDLQIYQKRLTTMDNTNSLATAEMQLESAQLGVRSADKALSNTEVKAPASGILTDFGVELGMTVPPSFKVGQVQQTDPLKIKAELTDLTANLVRGKSQLTFYIPGSTDKMTANISFLSEVMNAQTKAYDLELEVPNTDGKIKPGAKAQILLTDDIDQVVPVVPTLSLVREGGDSFLFVLVGDTVQKRKVELGRLSETNQEIISGVKTDETIVVSGQHQLKDQEKVKVAKEDTK
jgi:HlyD family secretion protein